MDKLNLNEVKNDVLGELDHLNSFIGLAKSFIKDKRTRKLLTDIQNDIFVIRANIAKPTNVIYLPENINQDRIIDIQEKTFLIEKSLKKIDHFILPEGNTAACMIHCARTIVRKIERSIKGYIDKPSLISTYFDRVACLMFVLSRKINQQNGFKERAPNYKQVSCSAYQKSQSKRRKL